MSDYNKYCIICGTYSKGKPQCHNCYTNTVLYEQEIEDDDNIKKNSLNLQDLFIKTINEIYFQDNAFNAQDFCCKLIAIGFLEKEYNDNSNLLNLAYTTLQDIRERLEISDNKSLFNRNEEEQNNNEVNDFRKEFPTDIYCQDGHYVRSKEERAIDDYRYQTAKLLHAYEPKFRLTPEEQAMCKNAGKEFEYFYPDFYIPKYNLYLEFFGRNEEKYNLKTDLKIKIYSNRKNINFAYLNYNDSNILLEKLEDILENFKNRIKSTNYQ